MRNIRLTLAYDGTNYVGWQVQPNGPSVQAAVERAIARLTGEAAKLTAAGRTDSGVHALGQVANFRTGAGIPPAKIRTGLQNFLPEDIVVRAVDEVPDDFHATYAARAKRYRYVIFNSRVPDPFVRCYAWRFGRELDTAAMHEAARALLGRHDFRCFESHFPNKASSVRTVMEAAVDRCSVLPVWAVCGAPAGEPASASPAGERPPFVRFDIVADGFLYNMVRAIAGTLLQVGLGKATGETVRRIIASGDRSQAGETAPAHGLYLVEVRYDEADGEPDA